MLLQTDWYIKLKSWKFDRYILKKNRKNIWDWNCRQKKHQKYSKYKKVLYTADREYRRTENSRELKKTNIFILFVFEHFFLY